MSVHFLLVVTWVRHSYFLAIPCATEGYAWFAATVYHARVETDTSCFLFSLSSIPIGRSKLRVRVSELRAHIPEEQVLADQGEPRYVLSFLCYFAFCDDRNSANIAAKIPLTKRGKVKSITSSKG